jgi:exonuclease III
MKKRRIDLIGVQETKWKGQKARMLSDGYKLIYSGSSAKQNGVAIVLAPHLANSIISIDRKGDRVMSVKIALTLQCIAYHI